MNPLDAFNEWHSEQKEKFMTLPDYPFRAEEARDIQKCLECLGSTADVIRIRLGWRERRNWEFPDWRFQYDREFAEWINHTA